ncbi:MAG: flagella basal body P-ring formation protein FlgA [Ponticaulis sp.]|nr:flagella basal body P-ring formation protein FlgA [Ponticaulis sp.]
MKKRFSHRFLILTLASIFGPGAQAVSDIHISGDWVTLGDVAPVSGAAAGRQIAAAPLPGQRMPLSSAFIEAQASAAGFPVDLPDGEMVWVARAATLQPAAQPQPQSIPATATIARETAPDGHVPVLVTDVSRGDVITSSMITYEPFDDRRRIQGLIRSADILRNTEATRTIRAGQPMSLRDIQQASVVKKGDLIQLIYERGPIKLVVNAKALDDAAKGETVRIQNLQSNRSMDAIAWGPGEARVGEL